MQRRPALNDIPLYVRAGAIIPMTPGIQYANERPDQVELHIYGGADGRFELYDDSGEGYGYESGAFRRWTVTTKPAGSASLPPRAPTALTTKSRSL